MEQGFYNHFLLLSQANLKLRAFFQRVPPYVALYSVTFCVILMLSGDQNIYGRSVCFNVMCFFSVRSAL